MTSFNSAAPAPTSASGTPEGSTPVATADQPLIEYGGRKLTAADVLKKLENADQFIEQLKAERAADRALLTEATSALKGAVTAKELLATPAPAVATPAAPVDIAGEVDRVVSAREAARIEEANWKAAQDAMTKAFGDKADEKAKAAAASIGYTLDELVKLARTKPQAFTRLFPELQAAPASSPTTQRGGVSTAAVAAQPQPKSASGYWEATKTRDKVDIYTQRLKQLSGV